LDEPDLLDSPGVVIPVGMTAAENTLAFVSLCFEMLLFTDKGICKISSILVTGLFVVGSMTSAFYTGRCNSLTWNRISVQRAYPSFCKTV
jgi:hypothetical protein